MNSQEDVVSPQKAVAPKPSMSHLILQNECVICGATGVAHFLSAPDRFHLRSETFQLNKCSKCGCVWQANPPQGDEMSIHYDEDYHRAIAAGGETAAPSRWQKQRETIARYKQGGSMLDIGCSTGGFLSTMKGSSWKLYGIEMEASTAQKARQNSGAEVFVGTADQAPYKAGSFDVVTCSDVLEHIYDPHEFLTNVLDWLKPGGIFYLVLPNVDSWESRLFGEYWYGLELPRHTFHFSPRSLRFIMNKVGFEEVTISTPSTTYVERSTGYLCSEFLQRAGFRAVPQSKIRHRGLVFRLIRKALRVAVVSPFGWIASIATAGGSMEALYKKRADVSAPCGK